MSVEIATRLQHYADVVVRVGLNLRAGQRLLLAEPFELQGVSREAAPLVDAVMAAAMRAGAAGVEVIWGDEARWRAAASGDGELEFCREVDARGERLREHAHAGGALLFLPASHPGLMAGIAADRVARLREVGWKAYGRVAPDLIAGCTNWTTAPAPTPTWAAEVFDDAPSREAALERLWTIAGAALRVDAPDPVAAWSVHLAELEQRRLELNTRRARSLRFVGEGTDLKIALAPAHRWCTAMLRTTEGRSFVANLPTEEIFTAPHRDSAEGVVRIARPVAYGGGVMSGITLTFRAGRVVRATAENGEDLLQRLLATDRGASRLGEVALVARPRGALTDPLRCWQHTLLDENARDHIALGESYPFTVGRPGAGAVNHSLVHVDLPIAAQVELEFADDH